MDNIMRPSFDHEGNIRMRFIAIVATTLILIASAVGQRAPASPQKPIPGAASTSAADQPPAHPVTPQQVHEILELTGANKLKDQLTRGMISYMQKVFPPYMPKDVIDDLESSMEKIDMDSMAVKAYQQHISTEDAAQLIAFYKTPAGRRVVSVLPLITQDLQEAGARQGMLIAQEVIERHRDEIRAAAEKYQQEHPDTPTITTPK